MRIRITVEEPVSGSQITRTYEYEDTGYLSLPWEKSVPEMIEQVTKGNETL